MYLTKNKLADIRHQMELVLKKFDFQDISSLCNWY